MRKEIKIAVITGTRADYGILKPVIDKIIQSKSLDLQLIVTGMHLEERFGRTVSEIEKDGFAIADRLSIDLSSDTAIDVTKATGRAVIAFADSYAALKPDIILLLGDRFEIFAAAQAALIARIPVAHISGGDVTEGAIDDSMRHCITKMSHIHFVTSKDAYRRVVQLGEDENYVHNFGNPSLDNLKNINFLDKKTISDQINFDFKKQNFLITFHPETIFKDKAKAQVNEVLSALNEFKDIGLIFTMPNADPEGSYIFDAIKAFAEENKNARHYNSLGYYLYFNVMSVVDVVIGNSSSGLLEAPSFNLPCVNIGERQKGRIQSEITFNADIKSENIIKAIYRAMNSPFQEVLNPYGDGNTSEKIIAVLEGIENPNNLLQKKFFDLMGGDHA